MNGSPSMWPVFQPALFTFAHIDPIRRWFGHLMDSYGFTIGETPFRTVFSQPGVRLRYYGEDDDAGPVLLIIPAPIKDASIWDLAPWGSVVRYCRDAGMRVYLIEWEPPDENHDFGLSDYADRFIRNCLDSISRNTNDAPVFAAGHSLGGTLAAIFAALHPHLLRGLVLLGSPLHFGRRVGAIDALVSALPRSSSLPSALSGNIPGFLMSTAASFADPYDFKWSRIADRIRSRSDQQAMATHLRVLRWAMQETPMARSLFHSVVEDLYRDDRFFQGELRVDGKTVGPDDIRAAILAVVDPRCRLVPPEAMAPFIDAVSTKDVSFLKYEGDTGVGLQHVGMLAGKEAHRRIWPKIVRWIRVRH